MPRAATLALLLSTMLLLGGCAMVPPTPAHGGPTPAELQETGRAALAAGNPGDAVDAFRRLEALYPEDPLAATARMELVFAYHQAGDPASAIAAAERFIRQYPDHANLDYLFYLRALAAFNRATGEMEGAAAGGTELRTVRPPSAEVALQYLAELIARYPQSRYGEDARNRVAHLRQGLAEIELNAAQHLLNQGQYANAGLRARALIENYPESGLMREAAVIVNMAHRMLNLEGAAGRPSAGAAEAPSVGERAATVSPATAPAGLRREPWILQQDPSAYTIQIFSTSSEEALLAFVARNRLQDAAYFKSGAPEQRWHSLIHGAFDSVDEARVAAERLPAALRGERPWIRRIGDLQALLAAE